MVRILLCGDARGRLDLVSEQILKLHSKLPPDQHFQAVFCVGEFSSEDMDLDAEPPIPVYFIDAGPAAGELVEASPQGEEVSKNLHFLGHFGVTKVCGLTVAFLSGKRHPDLFNEAAAEDEEIGAEEATSISLLQVESKYGTAGTNADEAVLRPQSVTGSCASNVPDKLKLEPSWEELKARESRQAALRAQLFVDGFYTPLAVERLTEEISDSGGVDLLLTSEWPASVLRGVQRAWPEEAGNRKLVKSALRQFSSQSVADLATACEPKYHAVGLGDVFWRRPPWKHERRGEVVCSTGELRCGSCRFVTLGSPAPTSAESSATLESPARVPQKWLHGLVLDPNALPAAADDATPSPWSDKPTIIAQGAEGAAASEVGPLRPEFGGMDKEERRRWAQRFGCLPSDMVKLSDKLLQADAPKEKKEKHKSLYKVSEKEKKRRKTGGDGHLPFSAKERMASNRG